ncbi:hypothetical protein HGRIS_000317 [Hohenbuehelia grisea]|uniref:Cytochrome P450 n=1 Tax=Hohenbuehelia grisea TaxID=104357 RepID=A0ABR3JSJ7_9AGAR
MINFDLLASLAAFGIIFVLYVKKRLSNVHTLPLPPGPPKQRFVGNLLQMPKEFEWETYYRWGLDYKSDIIHIKLLGTNIIVLNTAEAVNDLLEKRSTIYSSRAPMTMINDLMGFSFNFGFQPYGTAWRDCRRIFHREFHPVASKRFRASETKYVHRFLRSLAAEPLAWKDHLRHMAGAIVLGIAYGLDIQAADDPYIRLAEAAQHPLMIAAVPGAFLVDTIPWLKYVPAWFPGASFRRKAREWRKLVEQMCEKPFRVAKDAMAQGRQQPSFVSYCLAQIDESGDVAYQEKLIRDTAGTTYSAGADSTVVALSYFFLAMLDKPDVARKAQDELDRVVGRDRLPDFDDEDSLPYIGAIVKEVLRWRETTPIAVPHMSTEEDVYQGYRIPSGSVVIPNTWAILHDESEYPDPFTFNPDRFLKDGKLNRDIKDPVTAAFGYGRRICPGRYMVQDELFITIACTLAAFNISKVIGEDGKPIEPSHDRLSALVCPPVPFQCAFTPRSNKLVEQTAEWS